MFIIGIGGVLFLVCMVGYLIRMSDVSETAKTEVTTEDIVVKPTEVEKCLSKDPADASPRRDNATGCGETVAEGSTKDRQTVMFEARPIGFWARVVATFVDRIIVGFVIGFVVVVLGIGVFAIDVLIGICVQWLYCALMEASEVQATLGKLVIGAKVVDANGGRLTFGRATGRYFAKCLSALPMQIGYIMVAFDKRKRGLHDMIAGTFVISR